MDHEVPSLEEMLECFDFVDEYCEKFNLKGDPMPGKELSDNSRKQIDRGLTFQGTEVSTNLDLDEQNAPSGQC